MNDQPDNPFATQQVGEMEAFRLGEEQPAMRSVAIGALPKLTPLSTPRGGFGKAPALGLSRPKAGLTASKKSFTVTQEWTAIAPASWDVKGDLEMVPVDFPLERTHREISVDASEVAKRISESLHKLSIEAKYDNENAKAKCKTTECVKFRIRLYAGGDNNQPVVVELQRRSGSASSFMRSCRAVLDAAEGKEILEDAANNGATTKRFPPPMSAVRDMKCLKSVNLAGPGPVNNASIAFESSANLCKSEQRDSVLLGLQNLCNLTDPLKTSTVSAIQVSKWVLFGENEHNLKEHISSFLSKGDVEDEVLVRLLEQQEHDTLLVFANALNMCAKDGCLRTAMEEQPWLREVLMPLLLEAVRNAPNSAINAYHATQGINCLMSSSDSAVEFLKESDGEAALQGACKVGQETLALLARSARSCLDMMSNAC